MHRIDTRTNENPTDRAPDREIPTLRVVDSHTEGEPTRVVVEAGPKLAPVVEAGPGPMRRSVAERLAIFRRRFDDVRAASVLEPRGFEAMVGALLVEPASRDAAAGMIFWNNVGTLHMCGHGTIGVVKTLAHLGRIGPGRHRLESPVGDVEVDLHDDGSVSIDNVFSFRWAKQVAVETRRHGVVRGDVAWGGNWFFLVDVDKLDLPGLPEPTLDPANLDALLALCRDVLHSLEVAEIAGDPGLAGGRIDHVELYGPPSHAAADGKNFVLCPGGEYDRCPCGTGTSAKMACLAADGKLGVLGGAEEWRQEGILGTRFIGSARLVERDGRRGILPRIRGRAWITAESTLRFDPSDPFRAGIRGARR